MESQSASGNADDQHLSPPDATEDDEMESHIDQDASALGCVAQNEQPWITVTNRANKRRQRSSQAVTPQQQLIVTPTKPTLRQNRPTVRQPRLPPLPADDYKLAIRPRGGLQLSKVSPRTLLLAVIQEAHITDEKPDIRLRVDEKQNVLTLSTSSEKIAIELSKMSKITLNATAYGIASYGVAPDNSCKGVLYGIGHDTTPEELLNEIVAPGYEVLACRRLGESQAMVITFCGKRVPFFVNAYGQTLRCYLYKRTVPHCRKCNQTGHREDVCPQPPDTPKCRACGVSLTSEEHECRPRCALCAGEHPTAAKPCPKRFLPPVNRRKQSLTADSTGTARSQLSGSRGQHSDGHQSRSSERKRSLSRGRSSSRNRSGSRRRSSTSRSGTPVRARSPAARRGIKDGTPQVRWAEVVSPGARNPPVSPQLAQERALRLRAENELAAIKGENASLMAEITRIRADLTSFKEEVRKAGQTPNTSAETPPLIKRKRPDASTTDPALNGAAATTISKSEQSAHPTQYATMQQVEDTFKTAIQTLQQSMQQQFEAMQAQVQRQFEQFVTRIESQQGQFAAQANSQHQQFADHCVTLEARLTALEQGQFSTQANSQQHQFSANFADQWVKIEARLTALEAKQRKSTKTTAVVHTEDPVPYVLQDLPPYNDGNQDGFPTSAL
ncbi:hypothetical protein HPB48_022335 [Haemaphysalis longicornis]|uniref:CCHC-type domain-containing protein n=1 Tax=Haemaphysalis longicornis TaxID=44386 RepID=A0A9J6G8Q9_HAELO|nr:hypothetical protein HPB48_022335 [Haemaphysalis longicornis]